MTKPRIDYRTASPAALGAILQLERTVRESGLEPSLLHLVKLRASQLNGCAYCVDMHSKDARAADESEQRLYAVAVWKEAPFFTDRERAALEWTEAVTLLSVSGVPDDLFARVRECFTEKEIVDLTLAVATINVWNRLAVSFRPPVGEYQPPSKPAAVSA